MRKTTTTTAPTTANPQSFDLRTIASLNAGVRDVRIVALDHLGYARALFYAISRLAPEDHSVAKTLADVGAYLTEGALPSVEREIDCLSEIVGKASEVANG